MILGSPTASLELRILGYEFPHLSSDSMDSDWLLIRGVAKDGLAQWEFVSPCMTTGDAQSLVTFLDSASKDAGSGARVVFGEPNLQFEVKATGQIRVIFELEARPPWKPPTFEDDDIYALDLDLSSAQLAQAAEQLAEQLKKFPSRWRKHNAA